MENVKQLHETKSPHDIVVKGNILHFELHTKPDHTDVIYWCIREMETPFGNLKHKDVVFNKCIQVKWWQKLFGVTEEKLVKKTILEYKKFVAEIEAADRRGEELLKKLADLKS